MGSDNNGDVTVEERVQHKSLAFDEGENTAIEGEEEVGTPRRAINGHSKRLRGPSSSSYYKLRDTARTLKRTIHRALLRLPEVPLSQDGRQIGLDVENKTPLINGRTNRPFIDNTIRSSKYTLWNFLPRQLLAQFSKLANFYFLCVSIVQMIPSLSTVGRYTTLVPLLFFVGISILKEGHDDLRRSRLDKAENDRIATVLRAQAARIPAEDISSGTREPWVETKWQTIQVGDVLRIRRDQAVPADVVLLYVDSANGVAYIETMALDGETNLKSRQTLATLGRNYDQIDKLCSTKAHFVVETPNTDLHKFEGRVGVAGEELPLTNNEVLYRGSILRNTPQVFGIVIYTGEECKVRMNATKRPRIKASVLQTIVNKVVIISVFFVVALSLFNTIAHQIWQNEEEGHTSYLLHAELGFFQLLASFFLMFNGIIPLSLHISLEIVKGVQVSLMHDIDMYDESSDTPMQPRTSAINEDLGQVRYVFSDKTGTLTDNMMQLRGFSVAGIAWLHNPDIHGKTSSEVQIEKLLLDGATRSTEEMLDHIQNKPHTDFARKVRFFLLSIALCHTCFPEKNLDGKITFQGASADELALVQAVQDLGYLVVDRQSYSITIKTHPDGPDSDPVYETYEILDVLDFSSTRSRMSIVVRMPGQRICIFCKGSDTVIQSRLRLSELATQERTETKQRVHKRRSTPIQYAQRATKSTFRSRANVRLLTTAMSDRLNTIRDRHSLVRDGASSQPKDDTNWVRASPIDHETVRCVPQSSAQMLIGAEGGPHSRDKQIDKLMNEGSGGNDVTVLGQCFQHVNDFASGGLRTLLYAYRYVDDAEYFAWKDIYQKSKTSLANRQSLIEEANDQLEHSFELIGATAIEDKLQKGVPETIDRLSRANIRIWMLTGDKRETAINIGQSCRLIKDYSTTIDLEYELNDIGQRVAAAISDIKRGDIAHCVVIIDGQTLIAIKSQTTTWSLFIELIILADSVICCRASPSQKAFLVRSIRKRLPYSVTLAIGDGSNDVAMIQEAHVGIGIAGKEGLHAAQMSDYSIAQFRFLLKLLLVHGRWNYTRTCKYILAMFWKEMLLYITQALYQHWDGYTGTSLYEPWSLTLFQPVFTCLPVVVIGMFEKDLAASTLLAVPELYSVGQLNRGFNFKIYLWWAIMSICDATIAFFIMLGLYGNALFTKDNDLYAMGMLTFTACVIIISLKLQVLEMYNKSTPAAIAILFSIGSWFIWNLALSITYTDNELYNVRGGLLHRFGQNALWWLTLILTVFVVILFELAVSSIRISIWPTDVDIFREYERDGEVRKRFEEAAAEVLQPGSKLMNQKTASGVCAGGMGR